MSLVLVALPLVLAACAAPDEGAYPQLMPLSDLNQPPAIPAHAADAAADPQAVADALRARRAGAAARADQARGPVGDAAGLGDRARALRARADALARTDLPGPRTPAAAPDGQTSTAAPNGATSATDPATAARARALRERARSLADQPVGAAPVLPPCPPGTADPVAAACDPTR